MNEALSDRRMAENEVVFRNMNEQIPLELEKLKKQEQSKGHTDVLQDINEPLYFYCECSDENCRQRIQLKPSEYREFHQNSSQFIILPGHEASRIERTMFASDKFVVVEKYETPPQDVTELSPTPLNNT